MPRELRSAVSFDSAVFGVQADLRDRRPVARAAGPAARVAGTRGEVDLVSLGEERGLAAVVALARRHEADAAVLMVVVVPGDEVGDPATRVLDGEESAGIAGAVLDRPEERLGERIVIADAGGG